MFRASVEVLGSYDYDTQIGGETSAPQLKVLSIKVISSTQPSTLQRQGVVKSGAVTVSLTPRGSELSVRLCVTSSPARSPRVSNAPARHSRTGSRDRLRPKSAFRRRSAHGRREWTARRTRTGCDAGSLSQDVVTAISDLAQLLDGFIQVAALGGVPHGGAVEGAVEELSLVDMLQRIEQVFEVAASSSPGLPRSRSGCISPDKRRSACRAGTSGPRRCGTCAKRADEAGT